MRTRKLLGYCCLLLLAGSCTESERTPLAGHYYSSYTEDGDTGLYFDDPQTGAIELEYAYRVGVAKGCVVSCGDSGYLFPASANTVAEARRGQIGPLAADGCEQKVLQLTGDSLQLKSLVDF